ncbi:hypothetical protein ASPACDRAFT_43743 [Aspergillus aculeatus ATCC 16872]|uniref:Uncharacterized protein n=1 Tax=Aspergillus aculeatus (strain ATCC 16872 / CBS 172.66 / WB 5094) TaxID=690307 RepID=A0A1L9WSC4_ASPA1|nr:uncharacterized protein ASPACDRAFT_43743 [Aspergillus aculeatus ATCC 16872]OJJ99084.1 hypothetical protein ASPACDRAFT_43743 [Aspergillus aculeatus ATCC 16872]
MEANANNTGHSTPTSSSRVSSFLSLKKSQSSTNPPASALATTLSSEQPPPRTLFSSAQDETADLLKTVHHARTQLREVQRLYHLKATWLDATETHWIEATMADLDDAVRAAALLVEPARVEQETRRRRGSIGLATQLRWVCRDSRRARLQRSRLLMCHQSLMVVFERLRGVQVPTGGAAYQQEQDVMELPAGEVVRPEDGGGSVGGREEGAGGGLSGGLEEEMLDLLRWRQSKGNAAAVRRAEEVLADAGV